MTTGALLARNTMLSLGAQVTPLVVAVFAIPILVDRLGLERLGILSIAWLLLGYAGLFDLGIARAATRRTAELISRQDNIGIARLGASAVAANILLGAAGSVLLLALSPVIAERVLRVSPGLLPESKLAFAVLCCGLPITLAAAAVRGLIEGAQRFDLVTAIALPTSASTYVLPAAGALLALSLPAIIVLLLVARLASLAALLAILPKALPNLAGRRRPEWRIALRLVSYGGWLTVSSALGPAILYGERAIIASLLTASGLSLYVIPYELVARLSVVPAALAAPLFPAFATMSQLVAGRIRSTYRRALGFIVVVLGPVLVLLVSSGEPVLRGWLGDSLASATAVPLQLFATGVLANSLGYVPLTFLQASGRASVVAKLHILELPATYVVTLAMTLQFGLVGAALAWTFRVVVDAAMLFILAGRVSDDAADSVRAVAPAIGVVAAGIVAAALTVSIGPLMARTVVIAATLALLVAVLWRLALNDADRELLMTWARSGRPGG